MNGKQLRAKRMKLCLTQKQLAEKLGVASNTVARWERGERKMQCERAIFIALESFFEK